MCKRYARRSYQPFQCAARDPLENWTTAGAADIIALRCQHASNRWDELEREPPREHPETHAGSGAYLIVHDG
jgi:hypothetical protein